ncbi:MULTISPECIES: hypothetical protein [Sorangium]|uniref:hypothetical protein n=1 Tax=Sorangium TaxID=39643 RepID=UPI003D9C2066
MAMSDVEWRTFWKAVRFVADGIPESVVYLKDLVPVGAEFVKAHPWVDEIVQKKWSGRIRSFLSTVHHRRKSAERRAKRLSRLAPGAPFMPCALCEENVPHVETASGRAPVVHRCCCGHLCERACDGLPGCPGCRSDYLERQRVDRVELPETRPGELVVLLAAAAADRMRERACEHGVEAQVVQANAGYVVVRAKATHLDVLATGQRLVRVVRGRARRATAVVDAQLHGQAQSAA